MQGDSYGWVLFDSSGSGEEYKKLATGAFKLPNFKQSSPDGRHLPEIEVQDELLKYFRSSSTKIPLHT